MYVVKEVTSEIKCLWRVPSGLLLFTDLIVNWWTCVEVPLLFLFVLYSIHKCFPMYYVCRTTKNLKQKKRTSKKKNQLVSLCWIMCWFCWNWIRGSGIANVEEVCKPPKIWMGETEQSVVASSRLWNGLSFGVWGLEIASINTLPFE